ncbi:MAG: ribosomal protein small subunit ribosomal protein [Candidatus Parcubacteria bacterium]|jgi:small subunit ribosomal protein S5
MTQHDEQNDIQTPVEETVAPEAEVVEAATDVAAPVAVAAAPSGAQGGYAPRGDRVFKKNPRQDRGDRRGPKREPKPKPEFDQKIVDIRRVTRVTSGGRKFSFAVAVIAGDRKGRVGFGTGKGLDTAAAVDKAYRKAKKNLIRVPLTKDGLIPHEVSAKYSSARVEIRPAPGKGVVAGSAVRDVLEIAGIKDVIGKLRSGSKNKMNNAQAAITALGMLNSKRKVKHL